MALFVKHKSNKPALLYTLNNKLKEMEEKALNYFIYPLRDDEIQNAMAWAAHNKLIIQLSHKTDNDIYYKIYR